MTVTFTSTTALAPGVPAPDLDKLLLPQLKLGGYNDSHPGQAVLRVLCRALASGVSVTHARRWLVKNGSDEVRSLATGNAGFFKLVGKARAHVALHASPSGQAVARLTVARRLVARLTTPIGRPEISSAREIRARQALAVIGTHQIQVGFTKVLVSAGWLSVRMGLSLNQAQKTLTTLEKDLGWIARHGRRVDGIRWKLTPLTDEGTRERAWNYAATVDALAARTPHDDALAAVIDTAAHPAWCYSCTNDEKPTQLLGVRAWLVLSHSAAGLPDEEGLGLSAATVRRLRRELDTRLPGVRLAESDLLLDLDVIADETGASVKRAARDAEIAAVSAATKARFADFKTRQAAKLEVQRTVGRVLRRTQHVNGVLGPIPSDVAGLQAWASAAAAYFIAGEGAEEIGSEAAGLAREYLVRRIIERGHSERRAEQVARFAEPNSSLPVRRFP
jgi:hypothetical protein